MDAKVFTRLLVTKVNDIHPHLIDQHQTGFMPRRFIADNDTCVYLVMDLTQSFKLTVIALLLGQEKAYDRVHPDYLRACLGRFGIPSTLVSCILSLFFQSTLGVNVNGFLPDSIPQGHGLKQDNPLSPLLLNIAIEPFLRSVLSSLLTGFSIIT